MINFFNSVNDKQSEIELRATSCELRANEEWAGDWNPKMTNFFNSLNDKQSEIELRATSCELRAAG